MLPLFSPSNTFSVEIVPGPYRNYPCGLWVVSAGNEGAEYIN
jgi:hypothetical protein